jgi:hypothetical protein
MNKPKKIIFGVILALLLFFSSGFFVHQSILSWRWNRAVSAAGAMPFQVGLTNVILIPCTPSAPPPKCNGGSLCNTVDFATCSMYSEANGGSAGGTGMAPLLLSQIAIGQAGLRAGGQLIYGATTNAMNISANSVLASGGGCFGCMAKSGTGDKIFAWLEKLDKYIIAGFKGK